MKETILVVDDNAFERNLIVQALTRPGHDCEVRIAESAEAALAEIRARPPSVILMDCLLPGKSGFDALKEMRAGGLSVPVVMCTAEDARDNVLEALRAGATDYLVKDRSFTQLVPHAVDRALNVHRLQREKTSILERLKQSKDRYERLVVNAQDIMFQAEPSGRFLYLNAAVERHLGQPAEAFYAEPELACKLLHPEDRDRVREVWKHVAEAGGEATVETRVVAGGLKTLWFELELHRMAQGEGQAPILQGVARNVTESRELQRQLAKEKAQLEDANRRLKEVNRLKNEFVASVSHELRTPMNSIIGYTDCLLDGLDGPLAPDQVRSLSRVKNNAAQLLNLLNDILDLAKIEAGKMRLQPEDFDLAELGREMMDVIRPLVRDPSVQLLVEAPAALSVRADYDKVRRVLLNLLSNAVKFTRAGHVKLLIREHPSIKGSVKVEVQDTGIGIKEQDLPVIFDDFRQADGSDAREFGGTGLGLSITRKLVGLHSGEIWVKSRLGEGSTFHLVLPVSADADARPPETTGTHTTLGAADCDSRKLVLVVDPETDTVSVLKKMLPSSEFRVVGTADGDEAMGLARDFHPFAMLLDPSVAKGNGLPVVKAIKADPELRQIPVLIFTQDRDPALVMRAGATDCLVKPLEPRAVLQRLQELEKGKYEPSVLIVDDEMDVRDLFERMLRIGGYADIRTARNGVEALAEFGRRIPNLVLMGLTMPVMDGFEAISRIRKKVEHREVPIIVITGRVLSSQEESFLEKHVKKVVAKDALEERMLASALEDVLGAPGRQDS
jgi:PAS domain S-box-containing protein